MSGWVIGVWLVAYNNVMNLWPPFNGALYVPLNLMVAGLLVGVAAGPLDVDMSRLGIVGNDFFWSLGAAGAGMIVVAPALAAAGFRRTAPWVADERVARLAGWPLAYQMLVRVPFGTVVLEEIAFRGVLLAVLGGLGDAGAAIGSSVAFGLWHVAPTISLVKANRPDAGTRSIAGAVAGAVVFTTAAGLLLVWVRVAAGGIAAPVALHATVNSLGTLAAALAHRRLAR